MCFSRSESHDPDTRSSSADAVIKSKQAGFNERYVSYKSSRVHSISALIFPADKRIAGRAESMDEHKEYFAVDTELRTLAEAIAGADVFLGLSAGNLLKPEMVESMTSKPIVFALANPTPEIDPAEAKRVAPDAVIATGCDGGGHVG